MDKGKGVRKYGRVVQGLRWVRYIVSLIPAILMGVGFFCCEILGMGGVFNLDGPLFWCIWLVVFLACAGLVVAAGRVLIRYGYGSGVGDLWNPTLPEDNPALTDEELLVRSSSASAAQPAELLRAATETAEQKSEELLRTEPANVLLRRDR